MTTTFEERRDQVVARIAAAAARAGRSADRIRLVAVAKTADEDGLRAAWEAGQRHYAHNRVQRLVEHHAVLPEAAWHLVGPLQRNKARKAVERVSCIETVASVKLADALDRLAAELRADPLPVLVQVNLTPEDGRAGVDRAALAPLLEQLAELAHLRVDGLMTIATQGADEDALRRHFAGLRELAARRPEAALLPPDPELSMGMSDDFEIAVEEGATLVRVGRALFPPSA